MSKKQNAFKSVANVHQSDNNRISYFDGDSWDIINTELFGSKYGPREPSYSIKRFDKMVKDKNRSDIQGKSLVQLQDFVSHPAVKKHIENGWEKLMESGDSLQDVLVQEDVFGMDEENAKQYVEILEAHKTNASDSFRQAIENEMKSGLHLEGEGITDVKNMPYFHTEHSLQNYGYLPNYSQRFDTVQQADAQLVINDDGMGYNQAPQPDLTEQFG